MLTREAAEKLFAQNAALFGTRDGVPRRNMEQLFGKKISDHMFTNGKCGRDFNTVGGNKILPRMVYYATQDGFFWAVTLQNALECAERSTS